MVSRFLASLTLGLSLMAAPLAAQDAAAPAPAQVETPAPPPAPVPETPPVPETAPAPEAAPAPQSAPAPAVAAASNLPTKVSMDMAEQPENILLLDLSNGGRVAIRLMPEWAPKHVERIKTLTRQGFYNGVIFHRVIEGFMAQTGDPTGTGQSGSQLPDLKAEFNEMPHLRGTVSMARTDAPDSANSQFFIVFYPRFGLDRKYTVFGRVIGGMQFVDAIQRGEPPANPTRIVQASMASDGMPAPAMPAPAAAAPITADQLNAARP